MTRKMSVGVEMRWLALTDRPDGAFGTTESGSAVARIWGEGCTKRGVESEAPKASREYGREEVSPA